MQVSQYLYSIRHRKMMMIFFNLFFFKLYLISFYYPFFYKTKKAPCILQQPYSLLLRKHILQVLQSFHFSSVCVMASSVKCHMQGPTLTQRLRWDLNVCNDLGHSVLSPFQKSNIYAIWHTHIELNTCTYKNHHLLHHSNWA